MQPINHLALMRSNLGMSRLDVLATVGCVTVVGLLTILVLGAASPSSKRIGCYNNLRQIAIGLQVWGDDHTDRLPWVTAQSEGGTRPTMGFKTAVAWIEFSTLSNNLPAPRVLVCPEDSSAKLPSHSGTGAGGLVNSGYRANSLSYFLSYHGEPTYPHSVSVGDRDIKPTFDSNTTCSPGAIDNARLILTGSAPVAWTNDLHVGAGHLALMDGSVIFVKSRDVTTAINGPISDDGGSTHYLPAR
jgi:hypothetical protein